MESDTHFIQLSIKLCKPMLHTNMTLAKLTLTRDLLLRNIYKPFFDQVAGNFIRVKIKEKYYALKIMEVRYSESYKFRVDDFSGRTDIYVFCKLGDFDLELPICNLSNQAPSLAECAEYCKHNKYNEHEHIANHRRVIKKFEKPLAEYERIKTDDEKRKFAFDLSKRLTAFKNDVRYKQSEALIAKRKDLADELENVYKILCDTDNLDEIKINAIGRKYGLRVPGEHLKTEMVVRCDYKRQGPGR